MELRRVGAVVAAVAFVLVGLPLTPASASFLTPTSSDAADCNVGSSSTDTAPNNANYVRTFSCFFAGQPAGVSVVDIFIRYRDANGALIGDGSYSRFELSPGVSVAGDWHADSVPVNDAQAGMLRARFQIPAYNSVFGGFTRPARCNDLKISLSSGPYQLGVRCSQRPIQTLVNGNPVYPTWPPDPYTKAAQDATQVQVPRADCSRQFFTSSGGQPSVEVRQSVLNSTPNAIDVATIRFPWETADRPAGAVQSAELPAATSMPEDGWHARCTVTRNVRFDFVGSNDWKEPGQQILQDYPPGQTDDHPFHAKNIYATPPAVAPSLVPYIVAPGAGAALWAGTAVSTATWLGVPAAAVTGWNLGGWFIGKFGWSGDDEFFCRWNPGFKQSRSSYCAALTAEDTYLRSQILLTDAASAALTPSSTGTWVKAVTISEVLIKPAVQATSTTPAIPAAPEAHGKRTPVAIELPKPVPDPDVQTKLQGALDPAYGNKYAGSPGPNPDGSPAASPDAQTDPRPAPSSTGVPTAPGPATAPKSAGTSACDDFGLLDFLNPFNIVEVIKCVLSYLFIPTGGRFNSLKGSFDSSVGNLIGRPIDVATGVVSSLANGVKVDCAGPTIHVPGGPGWSGFDIQPLRACDGVMKTVADLIRPILVVMAYLGSVLASARLLTSAFGLHILSADDGGAGLVS